MKANEIIEAIEKMDNGERIKLLMMLFNKYFDSRPSSSIIEDEKSKYIWGEDE